MRRENVSLLPINMKKISYCALCKKQLSKSVYRYCKSCSFKMQYATGLRDNKKQSHPRWNGGKPHCIDCDKELSRRDAKRCRICANKKIMQERQIHRFCLDCGKELTYNTKRCHKCAYNGILNGRYVDGRSYERYPAEFTISLREKIRDRDNNRCVVCNMTREKHFQKYQRNLEVHHIDHNKKNCSESNLETRCKKCNIADNLVVA